MIRANDGAGVLSLSPSFNSYSTGKLAEIAARVVLEFRQDHRSDEDIYDWESGTSVFPFKDSSSISQSKNMEQEKIDDGDNDEFEFVIACREPYAAIISAEEIFYNGHIKPTYPLFDTDLLLQDSKSEDKYTKPRPTKTSRRSSLRMLMSEDRELTSSSSSEGDELGGAFREIREKSQQTETSKRSKFKDFLNRSSSDGKQMFMFLSPTKKKTNGKASRVGDNAVCGGEPPANQTEAQHRKKRETEEIQFSNATNRNLQQLGRLEWFLRTRVEKKSSFGK